jgi:hypothetical protein
MKESLESLISAALLDQVVASLVAEMHHIQGILLAVVHNFPRGVNLQRIHLEAVIIIGSTTTRWRDLRGGLLLVAAGSWSLGKLLGLGRGTTRGSTDILLEYVMSIIHLANESSLFGWLHLKSNKECENPHHGHLKPIRYYFAKLITKGFVS